MKQNTVNTNRQYKRSLSPGRNLFSSKISTRLRNTVAGLRKFKGKLQTDDSRDDLKSYETTKLHTDISDEDIEWQLIEAYRRESVVPTTSSLSRDSIVTKRT